jgi:putative acetyltransferase
MIIRTETPGDHAVIRQILIDAFANHPYSQQTEHLIVEGLRADDALTVSLVAEVDGKVVGQIAEAFLECASRAEAGPREQ